MNARGPRGWLRRHVCTRENALALALCLLLVAVLVVTGGQAPTWIYQGF
jgi:energy-coupling factor transporter transmembrane protein EcfT